MVVRLDTLLQNDTGTAWAPTGETILQLEAASSGTTVDVQARVHADAAWLTIDTLKVGERMMSRIAQVPFLRLQMQGNMRLEAVKVRDDK